MENDMLWEFCLFLVLDCCRSSWIKEGLSAASYRNGCFPVHWRMCVCWLYIALCFIGSPWCICNRSVTHSGEYLKISFRLIISRVQCKKSNWLLNNSVQCTCLKDCPGSFKKNLYITLWEYCSTFQDDLLGSQVLRLMGRKIKTSVLTPWKLSETETISPAEVVEKKKKKKSGSENQNKKILWQECCPGIF